MIRETAGTLLAIGLAALALGRHEPSSGTLAAERFVLLDGTGKTRGELSYSDSSGPSLTLYASNGAGVLMLGVGPDDQPRIRLLGNDAQTFLEGGTGIRIRSSQDSSAMDLTLAPQGSHIAMMDETGRDRILISENNDGSTHFRVADKTEDLLDARSSEPSGRTLTMGGVAGIRLRLPPRSLPSVTITDEKGSAQLELTEVNGRLVLRQAATEQR